MLLLHRWWCPSATRGLVGGQFFGGRVADEHRTTLEALMTRLLVQVSLVLLRWSARDCRRARYWRRRRCRPSDVGEVARVSEPAVASAGEVAARGLRGLGRRMGRLAVSVQVGIAAIGTEVAGS